MAKDTLPTIITTGVPDLESSIQLNAIGKRYGVKFHSFGCVVSKVTMDSIRNLNNTTRALLIKRFSNNWEKDLQQAYDTTIKIRSMAAEVIRTTFPNDDKDYYYLVTSGAGKIFFVQAYKDDSITEKPLLIIHYRMTFFFDRKSPIEVKETRENLQS
ncbi:hypothetical protein QTN47_05120 [Danxiaibacter flavus]|uniref:Uncharacterized protein n=1 Tax=Danxiaibacter flavus TaxID=3049108 RepID=A0ABV3ZAH3_9BACT|nr:hypothetical protein QNM32_05120 [Chitinophagaceae bacterium DXS]